MDRLNNFFLLETVLSVVYEYGKIMFLKHMHLCRKKKNRQKMLIFFVWPTRLKNSLNAYIHIQIDRDRDSANYAKSLILIMILKKLVF